MCCLLSHSTTCPELASAEPLKFRQHLLELIRIIIRMLSGKEEVRSYTVPYEIARFGPPDFFFWPRLRLVDPDSEEVGVWFDENRQSSSIAFTGTKGALKVLTHPERSAINLKHLKHPVTSQPIVIEHILEHLELIPTSQFQNMLHDAIQIASFQIPVLKKVGNVDFRIHGTTIKLDISRTFGTGTVEPVLIKATEIDEFANIFEKLSVPAKDRLRINGTLVKLGEKCTSMSDDNCRTCVRDRNWLCLRSLIGTYLKDVNILAHKGIEFYDLSGLGTVRGREQRLWGFAKLPTGSREKGLTLRNKAGAVLFAQISAQIDRTTFNTVLVVTPSVVNQDFQERLEVLCSAFGKRVCFLNLDDLGRMLAYFEEQALFQELDFEQIYKDSRKRK
jgi:hypothetical protein